MSRGLCLLLVTLGAAPSTGIAGVSFPGGSGRMTFNTPNIPRDRLVYDRVLVGHGTASNINVDSRGCTGLSVAMRVPNGVLLREGVYETGLAGVGVRFNATLTDAQGVEQRMVLPGDFSPTDYVAGQQGRVAVIPELVVVGPFGSGALSSLPDWTIGRGSVGNCIGPNTSPGTGRWVVIPPTVAVSTCSVTTGNVLAVNLPPVRPDEFESVGSSVGSAPFSISLACDAARIKVGITFSSSSVDSTVGHGTILRLQDAPDSASGVGIRILGPLDEPVTFGADSSAGDNPAMIEVVADSELAETIGFSAEYVRTGPITPGTVRAMAAYTMSYQ